MTEIKRRRKAESVQELDAKIAEMEAELAEILGTELSWDEITSTTADDLARKEQRRGMLPKLVHAAKVRRQELEVRRQEEEADALRGKLETTYEAFQAKEAKLRQVKEERDAAHGEWAKTLSAVNGADERTRRARLELDGLRGAGR